MEKIKKDKKILLIGAFIFAIIILFATFRLSIAPSAEKFNAPGKNWNSPKKVEDYFIERMNMPQDSAMNVRNGGNGTVDVRINSNTTLTAITGNLYYYGFIKDEEAFKYALEATKDVTPSANAIKVGKEGTIDVNAEYRISENMSAWEIADILLNKPSGHFNYDEYGYFFMP